MADSATIKLGVDDKDLDKGLKESEGMVRKWGKGVTAIVAAVGAAIVAKKIFDFGAATLDLFNEQQRQEKKLESVLKATEHAAGKTADELKAMASALQEVTTFGDEAIIGAQAIIATFKNIKGDEFDRATVAAMDMATVLEVDLAGAAGSLAKALNDPVKGMMSLADAGVGFTQEQKDMAQAMMDVGDIAGAQAIIFEELEGQFGGAAADAAETFGGKMQQMKNRLGDIGETIGGALIPILEKLFPLFEWGAAIIEQVVVPIVTYLIEQIAVLVDWLVMKLTPAFEFFLDGAIFAFTTVQTAIQNFSDVGRAYIDAFMLTAIKMWEEIKWIFGTAIPEAVAWFLRNWKGVLTDYVNFTNTVFQNLSTNLGEFAFALFNFFNTGKFEFNWKPLTKGFKSAIEESLEITKRGTTALESALEADLAATASRLENAFDKNLKSNMDAVNRFRKGLSLDAAFPEIKKRDISGFVVPTSPEEKAKAEKAKKEEGKEETATASLEGLLSLNARITQAAASQRPEEKVEKAVNNVAKAVEEGNAKTEKVITDQTRIAEQSLKVDMAIKKGLEKVGALT